jgi:chromate reductase
MQLLGICGSLRKASFNLKLLHEAGKRLPEGVRLDHADCGDLPLYNEDLDSPIRPAAVERIMDAIRPATPFCSPRRSIITASLVS